MFAAPKKILIMGIEYELAYRENLNENLAEGFHGTCLGTHSSIDFTIDLLENLTDQNELLTLLHEIAHSWIDNGLYGDNMDTEIFCNRTALILFNLFKENPQLIQYLAERISPR